MFVFTDRDIDVCIHPTGVIFELINVWVQVIAGQFPLVRGVSSNEILTFLLHVSIPPIIPYNSFVQPFLKSLPIKVVQFLSTLSYNEECMMIMKVLRISVYT